MVNDVWIGVNAPDEHRKAIALVIMQELNRYYKLNVEYDYCPECRSRFSFSKPVRDKCPWCGYVLPDAGSEALT